VIKKDGKWFRHENARFAPLGITQLQPLLPPFCLGFNIDDVVRKLKNRRVEGSDARCIEYDTIRGTSKSAHEVCIDKASQAILSYTRDDFEYLWSDYNRFDGRLLPHHAELIKLGDAQHSEGKVIGADFIYSTAALTPDSIVVPEGVTQDPVCRIKVPPSVKSAPDPIFPQGVSRHDTTVVLRVMVGLDGTTHDSQIVMTGGPAYDDAAQEAVKQWSFQPELCDGQHEESQITVEVKFHLR
jgi:TonB family protein